MESALARTQTIAVTRAATRPRVLLIEDDAEIAEPFGSALDRDGFEVEWAMTAAEALRLADESGPDIVLLDLGLPDADGRDVCRELRRRGPVPIVIVSARDTELDRIVGLELGADDYVVKPFSAAEVAARMRAVLRRAALPATGAAPAGRPARDGGRVEIDGLVLAPDARQAWLDGGELTLSRKEFDLLARLMVDAGRVVTRETLMAEVWEGSIAGSTKTLDVHIGWLRRKLGDDPNAPRFVHTVRGVGFRLAKPEPPADAGT